ncbi:MAG: DUF2721 domain-containing protein [Myxococcota bacterium]
MPIMTELITHALSPGIALTSVIFYNSSLQNRFIYITGRARELNREARQLRADDEEKHQARITSIRSQVDVMTRRARMIRHAILTVYVALFSFILTILELLAIGVFNMRDAEVVPVATFGLGFMALATATLFSWTEMALAQGSLDEDIRTSFTPRPPDAG